jgi:hypothetical protein
MKMATTHLDGPIALQKAEIAADFKTLSTRSISTRPPTSSGNTSPTPIN